MMGVLGVAGSETRTTHRSPTGSGKSDRSVDLATRVTGWLEEFLSGLALIEGRVSVDWTLLNPMFSALSALATALAVGGVL